MIRGLGRIARGPNGPPLADPGPATHFRIRNPRRLPPAPISSDNKSLPHVIFCLCVDMNLYYWSLPNLATASQIGLWQNTTSVQRGSLKAFEMQTIKSGMTREELLRVFVEEGGISTRFERRYAYRNCPYIKVDLKFESIGAPDDKLTNFPKDKIKQISKPFLEWSIND
jgi:hypothetical protein